MGNIKLDAYHTHIHTPIPEQIEKQNHKTTKEMSDTFDIKIKHFCSSKDNFKSENASCRLGEESIIS